ncbi:hypothetical protein [Solimonas terrae]|uniref:Uncharacterized protein n=1 Tax=Solimonas terrae TaxID=1396819 RepID=A0A6M2BVC3_9GAMM|nr:hypothetical protein [Solimonas terrae]NGY05897.1 hypothetical protein [Solimonas terrae]
MSVKELLAQRNLTSALIVDDAYDAAPRAEDLVADDDAWANFIADIGDDAALLREAFPKFDELDATALRRSDEFVAAAYGLKGKLREELWKLLFDAYEQGATSDRGFLTRLEDALKALGVEVLTAGRTVPENGSQPSIIFADLFLGAAQSDPDMERSLERLNALMRGREANPPLVILMSRSNLLEDKKVHFRDSAKLLGAMFRVYSKLALLEGATLERTLERLALHHIDAKIVAGFVHAWDAGLKAAAERFLNGIRRLDLSDYSQIRQVLLNFDGQPLGSYLLDVFDRVLQHEIEGDAMTIAAAAALNRIDTELYPPPYIAGSADLQDLVYRSIWQHPKRLEVEANESGAPVSFGDVLLRRSILDPQSAAGALEADALIVLTPACDLARGNGAKRIMLMAGSLADLTPKTWTYKGAMVKTPIVVLPSKKRMWIQWDVKDVRTLLPDEISQLLAPDSSYSVPLRLRESHVLELQQKLLSDMGRVGLVTQMPATFPVSVAAFTVGTDGVLQSVALPAAERDGGVCFSGRDSDSNPMTRLVLTDDVVDELLTAISRLDENTLHTKARDTLKKLKASASFAINLQRGVDAPDANKSNLQQLKARWVEDGKSMSETVGMIVRNPPSLEDIKGNLLNQYGALVLVLHDSEQGAALVSALAEESTIETASAAGEGAMDVLPES